MGPERDLALPEGAGGWCRGVRAGRRSDAAVVYPWACGTACSSTTDPKPLSHATGRPGRQPGPPTSIGKTKLKPLLVPTQASPFYPCCFAIRPEGQARLPPLLPQRPAAGSWTHLCRVYGVLSSLRPDAPGTFEHQRSLLCIKLSCCC